MSLRPIYLSACLLLLLLTSGCSTLSSVTNSAADRDHDWSRVTLAGSGFDMERMRRLNDRLETGYFPNIHAVLIEHNARLVYEKYLAGEDEAWGGPIGYREFNAYSRHDLRSVSKSITSLLLGIALGDDFQTQLSRPIVEYFPELTGELADGVEQVTLYHVLTMTAGFEWNEMEVIYASLNNDARRMHYAEDPVRYALTKPLISKPGERWYYNSGMTMVIAAVVEKVSGQPFLEFAEEVLGEPLAIGKGEAEWRGLGNWPRRPTLPGAASGLRATARSLAKTGALVLDQGRWQGRQVVPRKWIEVSTQRLTEQTFPIWSFDGIYGYGFQWWQGNFTGEYGDFSAIVGVGYGGQRLFIVPERDLVVTIFAGNYDTGLWRVSEQVMAEIIAAAP
jgi:CubicO group peptidase (beta-lactamase class C family)